MDALREIEKAITAVKAALDEFGLSAQQKAEEVQSLNDQIVAANEKLAGLEKDHDAKQSEYSDELTKTQEALGAVKTKLDNAQDELETAQDKLEVATKRHGEFVAYEARANAALQAFETSLLKREESLDNIIGTAKRRASILSEIK